MTLCDYCQKPTFACPDCSGEVQLTETVDIFHVGQCLNCGNWVDEPCEKRLEVVE